MIFFEKIIKNFIKFVVLMRNNIIKRQNMLNLGLCLIDIFLYIQISFITFFSSLIMRTDHEKSTMRGFSGELLNNEVSQSNIASTFLLLFSKLLSQASTKNKRRQNRSSFRVFLFFNIISLLIILIISNDTILIETKQRISILSLKSKISQVFPQYFSNGLVLVVGFGCEIENIDQGRSFYQMSINISHCSFSRYSQVSGDGGVIYVSGGSFSMNVNDSIFYNCLANNGGAICFSSYKSHLRMICANRCSCGSQMYHFAFISASHLNQVEYLSISFCPQHMTGSIPICLQSGNQMVDNTNSSMNNPIQVSGIGIWSPSSFTSSHCTFSNNKVSQFICVWFSSVSGSITMCNANIVHCNSPSSGGGVVYVSSAGFRKMMYCIFQNNQNHLFCVLDGSLEVSHSFIDHSSSSIYSSTAVSTATNNSFTKKQTYPIQFFHSHYCNADIPLPQRTIEKSPNRSFEKTFILSNRYNFFFILMFHNQYL